MRLLESLAPVPCFTPHSAHPVHLDLHNSAANLAIRSRLSSNADYILNSALADNIFLALTIVASAEARAKEVIVCGTERRLIKYD